MDNKWDIRFIQLARHIAQWSKDPSTKCGAVIVNPRKIVVGMGYNGFAQGMNDFDELYRDRDIKYSRIIHADINAILNATVSVRGCTFYSWPFPVCDRCAPVLIQAGIARVVSVYPSEDILSRWRASIRVAEGMFNEANVIISLVDNPVTP